MSLKNIAEIDVKKLVNNVLEVKKLLSSGQKLCAVIKCDAYGHGAVGISSIIEKHVDCFAVALAEEAIELRLSGISKPILVLIPTDFDGVCQSLLYDFEITIGSDFDLFTAESAARAIGRTVKFHIKINTGMNRFGFDDIAKSKLDEYCKRKLIKPLGCFSHLFNSNDYVSSEKQLRWFSGIKDFLSKKYNLIYHLASSGGLLLGDEFYFDMVRVGLLIYGYNPGNNRNVSVSPILKIKAKSLFTRQLNKGTQLFYGNNKIKDDVLIDIIRCGYGDGLNRSSLGELSNACMDVCSKKHTNSQFVDVFDDADIISKLNNTIPYEVLCGIANRSNLVYKDPDESN